MVLQDSPNSTGVSVDQQTPLVTLARYGHLDVVEILLNEPCIDITFGDKLSRCALSFATGKRYMEIVDTQLDDRVSGPYNQDIDKTTFFVACQHCSLNKISPPNTPVTYITAIQSHLDPHSHSPSPNLHTTYSQTSQPYQINPYNQVHPPSLPNPYTSNHPHTRHHHPPKQQHHSTPSYKAIAPQIANTSSRIPPPNVRVLTPTTLEETQGHCARTTYSKTTIQTLPNKFTLPQPTPVSRRSGRDRIVLLNNKRVLFYRTGHRLSLVLTTL